MKSWDTKVDSLSSSYDPGAGPGPGGDVGWEDLVGVPNDSAAFNVVFDGQQEAISILGDRLTTCEAVVAGNLTEISEIGLTENSLLYQGPTEIDELTLGANLAITSGVLNVVGIAATSLNGLSDVTITTPATGQFLKYVGAQFVNANLNLSQLSDVDLTGLVAGDILMYDGTDFVRATVPTASESLVFIRGSVESDGFVAEGSGFTVTVMGTGDYRVNFTNPFSANPSIVATPYGFESDDGFFLRVTDVSTTSCRVRASDYTGVSYGDIGFCFIAVGV